jgi:hypothetical protein
MPQHPVQAHVSTLDSTVLQVPSKSSTADERVPLPLPSESSYQLDSLCIGTGYRYHRMQTIMTMDDSSSTVSSSSGSSWNGTITFVFDENGKSRQVSGFPRSDPCIELLSSDEETCIDVDDDDVRSPANESFHEDNHSILSIDSSVDSSTIDLVSTSSLSNSSWFQKRSIFPRRCYRNEIR